jgi:23S rRNA pseudouridine1911/1915/1917 synthase
VIEDIPAALAGERVDRVVSMLAGLSRADAAELVASSGVLVNGDVVTSKSHRVAEGDEIEVHVPTSGDTRPEPDVGVEFAVVHEDHDLVVVDKPPGLVVHPAAGTPGGTLVNGLLARYPEIAEVGEPDRPGIVHRLDKDTSGLLLVARSPAAYERLRGAIAAREVERVYRALVWERPPAPSGLIDAPIGRAARAPTRMAVSEGGRQARTRYTVERTFTEPVEVALLECRLDTGRTHQIRVHLAAIDHPVVGDDRYGGARQTLVVPRPFLHATELGLTHPTTGEALRFESPLPADLRAVLDSLR